MKDIDNKTGGGGKMKKIDIKALKDEMAVTFSQAAFSTCSCGRPERYCTPNTNDIPYKRK